MIRIKFTAGGMGLLTLLAACDGGLGGESWEMTRTTDPFTDEEVATATRTFFGNTWSVETTAECRDDGPLLTFTTFDADSEIQDLRTSIGYGGDTVTTVRWRQNDGDASIVTARIFSYTNQIKIRDAYAITGSKTLVGLRLVNSEPVFTIDYSDKTLEKALLACLDVPDPRAPKPDVTAFPDATAFSTATVEPAAEMDGQSGVDGGKAVGEPLLRYDTQYPFNRVDGKRFVEQPRVSAAIRHLQGLSAEARQWIASDDIVTVPIEAKASVIVYKACEPHNCDQRNWSVSFDTASDDALVCWKDENREPMLYSTQDAPSRAGVNSCF